MNASVSQPRARVLIVDDEPEICALLARILSHAGFDTLAATDGRAALQALEGGRVDVALLDFRLPDMTGLDVLREARRRMPHLPAVMITAHADVRGAVEAMRAGVYDYIAKPFDNQAVLCTVQAALAKPGRHDPAAGAGELSTGAAALRDSMGPSDAVGQLIARIELVAKCDFAVLILGETGTGKELVAHALHQASRRHAARFLPVDCGAIPEHLLESELFGYEKGAFTGATAAKAGKLSAAQGGTLFLDEIANLPLAMQAKLLRVLQERVIYRVGSNTPQPVDVRIVAAANEDLEHQSLDGSFRSDLFFRLSEFVIRLPPLRERPEDVHHLAQRFLALVNDELGKAIGGFSAPALERLASHPWPGNVRQLRNCIRRAALLASETVELEHLDLDTAVLPSATLQAAPGCSGLPLKELVRRNIQQVERQALESALHEAQGNKAMAARLLRIDYKTIHTKIKEYGIRYKDEE